MPILITSCAQAAGAPSTATGISRTAIKPGKLRSMCRPSACRVQVDASRGGAASRATSDGGRDARMPSYAAGEHRACQITVDLTDTAKLAEPQRARLSPGRDRQPGRGKGSLVQQAGQSGA